MQWITRERPKIDRIACPWLIARFIDETPDFLYVPPGDVLRMVAEIVEVSPAKEAGGRDAIRIRYDTFNQDDELVMTLTSLHFVKRRPADHG